MNNFVAISLTTLMRWTNPFKTPIIKLTQKEIENLNSSISIKEMEFVIKVLKYVKV